MMTKKINVWGREFSVKLIYDRYSGEEILDSQRTAAKNFIQKISDVNQSLDDLKNYIISHDSEYMKEETISNIFKYINPDYIYVSRSSSPQICALICDYRLNPDNGIAIVFQDGKYKGIEPEDKII